MEVELQMVLTTFLDTLEAEVEEALVHKILQLQLLEVLLIMYKYLKAEVVEFIQ